MKKLLTLICLLAVGAEFGYLLLKDHPNWPQIVWTPTLWTAESQAMEVPETRAVYGQPMSSSDAPNENEVDTSDSSGWQSPEGKEGSSIDADDALASVEREQVNDAGARDNPGVTRKLLGSSVRVVLLDARDVEIGIGCGVVVETLSDGLGILTANHVISGGNAVQVDLYSMTSTEEWSPMRQKSIELVHADADRDLAYLRLHWPTETAERYATLNVSATADEEAWVGQRVWLADLTDRSNPQLLQRHVVEQKRARRDRSAGAVDYFLLDEPSRSGMSGGGLVDKKGDLIGIASGNSAGQAHCITSVEVNAFLRELQSELVSEEGAGDSLLE